MKNVLCYGDSNTYGYNPRNGLRYSEDVRWTGQLQRLLGKEYKIIEEGCNGRTTVFDDPLEGWKNGRDYLRPCLNSHKPLDIVIMMLGSNDMKEIFHATPEEIAAGAAALVDIIKEFTQEKQGFVPQILLVAPPWIGDGIAASPFYGSFRENAVGRSWKLGRLYSNVAAERGCAFLDAGPIAPPSVEDSLHLSPESHAALAEAIAAKCKSLSSR